MEGQARWCRFLSCLLSHLFYILLRRFTKRKRSPDVEAAGGGQGGSLGAGTGTGTAIGAGDLEEVGDDSGKGGGQTVQDVSSRRPLLTLASSRKLTKGRTDRTVTRGRPSIQRSHKDLAGVDGAKPSLQSAHSIERPPTKRRASCTVGANATSPAIDTGGEYPMYSPREDAPSRGRAIPPRARVHAGRASPPRVPPPAPPDAPAAVAAFALPPPPRLPPMATAVPAGDASRRRYGITIFRGSTAVAAALPWGDAPSRRYGITIITAEDGTIAQSNLAC